MRPEKRIRPDKRAGLVLATQQTSALAVVAAVAVSAAGVAQLDIVAPEQGRFVQAAASPTTSTGSLVSSAAVRPTVRSVPLDAHTSTVTRPAARAQVRSRTRGAAAQEIRVLSPVEPTHGFATVGVSWRRGQHLSEQDISVSVRTRLSGTWSRWQEMDYDADHGPDPGSAEAKGVDGRTLRDGTDAVAVGRVQAVQVRAVSATGSAPAGLSLAVVDPGQDAAAAYQRPAIDTGTIDSATSDTGVATGSGQQPSARLSAAGMPTAPKPQIYSRAQWGADERLRDPGSLHYGDIQAAFVHHTVNANDYAPDDVPAILRGIYAYHTQVRGWSDIGYNFLVDRFGRIWEGRYGGVDRPVVGAHTLGYNDDSFAMSAIGNFEEVRPSEAMVRAYAALFAWKLSLYGIDAADTHQYVTSRWFQAVNGHRDAASTACPGRYLYARIPDIRSMASALQHTTPAATAGKALDANISGSSWPDLVVRDRATHHAVVVRTGGQVDFLQGVTAATGWSGKDLVAAVGDADGDGIGDVVARDGRSGRAALYRGSEGGRLGPASALAWFSAVDQLSGVGDFDGDGHDDVVARRSGDKALMLYPGTGRGTFAKPHRIAADWGAYDVTTGVDDFDGDGHPDLLARAGDALSLVRGTGTGLRRPVALGSGWRRFDLVTGRGDVSGDGLPDVVARTSRSGKTFIYPGNGEGGLLPRIGGFPAYAGARWLALGARLAGSRRPDLVALDGAGTLRAFPNSGRRNIATTVDTGVVLDDVDLILNVGDWNGDGRGDVMTRTTGGTLQLRAGLRASTFAPPVTAGRGFGSVSLLAGVGDVTGDGHPDLVGRDASGARRIYPGDGAHGFGPSRTAGATVAGSTLVALGLWDKDALPDVAVRRAGVLWLLPSTGGDPQRVSSRVRRYDWLLGLGDVDGDGRSDLVARARRTGVLWLLPGTRDGLGPRRVIGGGFRAFDLAG